MKMDKRLSASGGEGCHQGQHQGLCPWHQGLCTCPFLVDIELMSGSLWPLSTVRDLGVTIDSRLTIADHVSAVCRACYFQLRQLRVVLQSLTSEAAKSRVHAFVSCHLDYCNALLYGIAYYQFQRLQSELSTERYYEATLMA